MTEGIYERAKQRAQKEHKSAASFVSEALEIMLFVEEKFSNCVPYPQIVSVDKDEVIIRDNKIVRVVGDQGQVFGQRQFQVLLRHRRHRLLPAHGVRRCMAPVRSPIRRKVWFVSP